MKKVFLLLAAAICATTSSFAVTYELNGGQYNPYGWTDKDQMLQAFLTDGGAAFVCGNGKALYVRAHNADVAELF